MLASQHSTYISVLTAKSWAWADAPLAVIGLTLFLAGMFYKLALFPFHFCARTSIRAPATKPPPSSPPCRNWGAVVVLVRLSAFLTPGLEITTLLAWLCAISMTLGNLSALAQTDVKRLLGFSSVAHAGYIMVGLVTGTAEGMAAGGLLRHGLCDDESAGLLGGQPGCLGRPQSGAQGSERALQTGSDAGFRPGRRALSPWSVCRRRWASSASCS